MRESLRLMDLEEVMHKYGISKPAMYNWYNKVLEALPDILANVKPGRKPSPEDDKSAPPF